MNFAPQHNWAAHRQLTRASDEAWVRELSVDERFSIYSSLFNALWQARESQSPNTTSESERLDQWRWKRKLADRDRLVQTLLKHDAASHERPAPSHAG